MSKSKNIASINTERIKAAQSFSHNSLIKLFIILYAPHIKNMLKNILINKNTSYQKRNC